MKKVAVIILNYKVKDDTLKCISSVVKSTYQTKEIIVVDNNSQDQLGKALKEFINIEFIQNNKNLGYSGGNNVGIKKALSDGADYIFVLNPDTKVEENTISSLVETLENEKADIESSKIYFQNSNIIWYAGGKMDLKNVLGSHRGVDEKDKGQYNEVAETDFATGAAIFIKRRVFEKIGLFDERYFLYYEDADFCMRAKKAGFKIIYAPGAIVYHKNATSTGLGSPLQDYYITRNRMLFAAKFLPLRTRLALFKEALKNLRNAVRREAFVDFMMGNFGKRSI